jgi:hypothetical protein
LVLLVLMLMLMLLLLLSARTTHDAEELQGGQKANTHILRISLVDKVEVSGSLPFLSGLGCS